MMDRRDAILGAAAAGGLLGFGWSDSRIGAPAAKPRRPRADELPARIAFGSCLKQDAPQPIWNAVNELRPDLFVFLGDNIYGDTRDPAELRRRYAQLAAQPGFRRLCAQTAVLAIWDDHDYGEDDAGAEYPAKEASRAVFCDFWNEPPSSPRRSRDGIYDAVYLQSGDRRLQIILPDLRFNRTPIRRRDLGDQSYKDWSRALELAGKPVPGPYEPNWDPNATMLGTAQWQWLEAELRKPADLRILASSLQVVADFPGWEAWVNYPADRQRLLDALRRTGAASLVCISGDTHYGELSLLNDGAPYPLWDLTSSGLTEVWPVTPPNDRRIGEIVREINFGWIEIDWSNPQLPVTLQIRAADGEVRLEQRLNAAELRAS
ncbi:MAG: alkaline phosphatase family protein [Steroidobacteraceae bacterium]|nr:alkaline phosphatase family protein [Steroidobacteraceae bacterium]MDW8259906.1 alkaline phosphatase D family protein [Gammaproteobacteria bacterium]